MVLEEVAEPSAGAGQVVVRIHAAGVNPVDTYIRGGAHAVKPDLPYTPGIDGAGTVVAAGRDVTRLVAGDRVYVSGAQAGTYAETIACAESQAHRLPGAVSFEQGAAVGVPYVTAFRALFQIARAVPGESLLVHGASGGTGTATVQLAHAAGLTVIGTAGTEAGRALVREQGASHALDHNDPGLEKQVMELTGGRGVDIIVEMLANRNLAVNLRLVARRGRVVVVGSRGPVEINPRDAMVREASIFGTFCSGYRQPNCRRRTRRCRPRSTTAPYGLLSAARSRSRRRVRRTNSCFSRALQGRSSFSRSAGCSRTRWTTSPRDSWRVPFRRSTGRIWRTSASVRGTSIVTARMQRSTGSAPASGG